MLLFTTDSIRLYLACF